jgi:hypothetical protein
LPLEEAGELLRAADDHAAVEARTAVAARQAQHRGEWQAELAGGPARVVAGLGDVCTAIAGGLGLDREHAARPGGQVVEVAAAAPVEVMQYKPAVALEPAQLGGDGALARRADAPAAGATPAVRAGEREQRGGGGEREPGVAARSQRGVGGRRRQQPARERPGAVSACDRLDALPGPACSPRLPARPALAARAKTRVSSEHR